MKVKLKGKSNDLEDLVTLLNYISDLLFEKTYLIVLKDETSLKTKLKASSLILIGSYVRKIGSAIFKKGEKTLSLLKENFEVRISIRCFAI